MRNRQCGVCASDLHLLHVTADPRVAPALLPGTARIYLGHEVVGEVVETGPKVGSLAVGDRVILGASDANCLSQELDPPCRHCRQGNYWLCENASLGQGGQVIGGGWGDGLVANESQLYPVPEGLSDDQATLLEPLSVAVRTALRRLPLAGEKVLVVGGGILGLGVVGALRALAPESFIAITARYPQQQKMASKLGADEVLQGDVYQAAARLTGGRLYTGFMGQRTILGGFDIVYDCVGSAHTLQDSLRWARAGGTVVLAGICLEPMRLDLTPVWYQEVNLVGLYRHGMEEWQGKRISTYDLTARFLLEGDIDIDGLITHRFPLERWQEAVRTAQDKRSGSIKVLLEC
ncbi:MAG: alcohol dehydrogenase catalytic domain-containing protein [Chloroflexi bacterium]|nr:alcohol dehydrogenase catalytic domain-containing protein [Chloroflexota bacterium]